ncbi:MAG: hypothetical protein QM753_13975 [Thermomicrobiales bacterium]
MSQGNVPTSHTHRIPHRRRLAGLSRRPRGGASAFLPESPRRTQAMLAGMALLMLLMPTNYRAGTGTDHPHAFFQEVIDILSGTPHEHGAEIGATHVHADGSTHAHKAVAPTAMATATATISPFLAADIPLAAAVRAAIAEAPTTTSTGTSLGVVRDAGEDVSVPADTIAAPTDRDTAVASLSPDLPSVSDFAPAAEKGSAILMLTTLLAGILLAASRRREFADPRSWLTAIAERVESPPPRIAPC